MEDGTEVKLGCNRRNKNYFSLSFTGRSAFHHRLPKPYGHFGRDAVISSSSGGPAEIGHETDGLGR